MIEEPSDLATSQVAQLLVQQWRVRPSELEYAPLGHGSYHWIGHLRGEPRWFVTADRLADDSDDHGDARLAAAARTASELARDGCEFVLAPLPDADGALVRRQDGWAFQVHPYVRGWSTDQGSWDDPEEQARVARLVGRLHRATPPSSVPRWEFAIPGRARFDLACAALDTPWSGGPYAAATRDLLGQHLVTVREAFDRYDRLAAELEADPDPWVVTHGEPDSDNVIRAEDGRAYLIDWGTAKLAPRERDLVEILNGVADVLPAYQETAGQHPARPAALELFALWWSLLEVCRLVDRFRGPHTDSATASNDWNRLRECLANPGGWFRPAG